MSMETEYIKMENEKLRAENARLQCLAAEQLEPIVIMMKKHGVQRLYAGQLNIELQWQQHPSLIELYEDV